MTKKPIRHIHIQHADEGRTFSESQAADALRFLSTKLGASLTIIFEDGKYAAFHSDSGSAGTMTENEIKEFVG